jgi:predicted NAD/FAD-binding protein
VKIAIVGSGISGLGAAYALDSQHDVTIFERDHRLGGHASTVDVDHYGPRIAVDTGFIIFNRLTYPNLTRLFRELKVRSLATQMGFSVSLDDGRYEWATGGLAAMFAQPENALNPKHYALLLDILRFFRVANADLAARTVGDVSLRDYLAARRFNATLIDRFIVPMGGSIWSATARQMLEYPAETLLTFMKNHQLLQIKQPVWLTVEGGSRTYVDKLTSRLRARIHKNKPIKRVEGGANGAVIFDDKGERAEFDAVILACHSTDALDLLDAPTDAERSTLSAMRYQKNTTILHGDTRLMPKRRAAWSSWNYTGSSHEARSGDAVGITYWMNKLQHIDESYPLFVTLNPRVAPNPDLVFASFDYEHPQYDRDAIKAQQRLHELQGARRIWFCGAYTGYGFHEDGLRSGLEVAQHVAGQIATPLLGHARIFT